LFDNYYTLWFRLEAPASGAGMTPKINIQIRVNSSPLKLPLPHPPPARGGGDLLGEQFSISVLGSMLK